MSGKPALRDLRILGEAVVSVVVTWALLGWPPGRMIPQLDGAQLVAPYVRGALAAGPDWQSYLYRFGVLGGSELHALGGSLPLVQACAALGLSTTTTLDAMIWFVQVALAYFAIVTIEALASAWSGAAVRLDGAARVVAVWLCAFAPVLGWRLGTGHDNLVFGLLPFAATLALVLAAGSGRLTATALVMAAFAVANGVSGLGAQTVLYGAVFGAPLVLAAVWTAPPGQRWTRELGRAAAALAAGVLLVVPRVLPMALHATGDDATRSLGADVVYSYGRASSSDWLTSLGWTSAPAFKVNEPQFVIEHNFPIGPLLVFAVLLWPRDKTRRLAWAALVSAVFAIALADHVAGISTALLAVLPPLSAFRVPARAILPVLVALPPIALAAWTRAAGPAAARVAWPAVAGAMLLVLLGGAVPAWPRELIAWAACAGLAVLARRAPRRWMTAALAPVAALGVLAFAERLPAGQPYDAIEDGPALVHARVGTLPPLARVELADPPPPPPYGQSLAWAAGVGTLDGIWYPSRRFLALVSAVEGKSLAPTTSDFALWRSSGFPIYQQLYDVVGTPLPAAPGAAWFPARVTEVADAATWVGELRAASPADLHAAIAGTAWLVGSDPVVSPIRAADPACARAGVGSVTVDADDQVATIALAEAAPADCVLIVATSYAGVLRASTDVGDAPVFPVDIALTGIAVPRHARHVVLGPAPDVPTWTRVLGLLGALLLVGALVIPSRRWS